MDLQHGPLCTCPNCLAMRPWVERLGAQAAIAAAHFREQEKKLLNGNFTSKIPPIADTGSEDPQFAASTEQEYWHCRHLGEAWATAAIAEQGLNPERSYRRCAMGQGSVAGFVCPCSDCGPKCSWFDAPPHEPLDLGE